MKTDVLTRFVTTTAGLLLVGFSASSCSFSAFRTPSTPAPHAFISYYGVQEGGTGLRLAVKDLIDIRGEVTSAGSEYLYKHAAPATKDAACLRIARERGVAIVGKANLSEFAISPSGSNDYFGTPVNPIDKRRVPGGSSSGSAVAVAMDLADVAFGSDTAGSVRVPAACCGIVGMKTTYGLVSLEGVYPISEKYLDTVGPLARDVEGAVAGMGLLREGFEDLYERAKARQPTADVIRIGRLYVPGTDQAIDRAIDAKLTEKGFQVYKLSDRFVEAWKQATKDGNFVAAAFSWRTNEKLRKQDEVTRRSKGTIWAGDVVYKVKYKDEAQKEAALARRAIWQAELDRVLRKVDAIALPVLKSSPLKIKRLRPVLFEGKMLESQNTVAVNYAGNPALAVPVPVSGSDFPVTSVQFIGRNYGEAKLLNIGRLVESE